MPGQDSATNGSGDSERERVKEVPELTDRERILIELVSNLASMQMGCVRGWDSGPFKERSSIKGLEHVHFAFWDKPKPGDLVLAQTGGAGRWKVGWYVEPRMDSGGHIQGAVIRELGSDVLCNYDNESFVPIRGLSKLQTLEGDQRRMLHNVHRAFSMGDEYMYRFGGIDFDPENIMVIWVREAFGGILAGKEESIPFAVRMKFDKRTGPKAVLKAMRSGGYGTKKFERKPITQIAPSSSKT